MAGQTSNYWGNQNIGAMQQQAQVAGTPQQSNYQAPTGSGSSGGGSQANWGAPQQGAWQSPPPSGGSGAAPQSSSQGGGAAWGAQSGQGGWGQPQPQQQAQPQSWWQQGQPGPQSPQGGGTTWQQPQQQGGGNAASAIVQAYQQYLGRSPSQEEIALQLRQPNLQTQIQSIQQSPEAAAYQQRAQGQPPPSWWQQGAQGSQRPMPPQGSQNWNTDGYARPNYIAQRPAGHPPPGWDRKKWNDPSHQTPKYVIGRILSQFSPRTSNMDAVIAEIGRAYPGARRTGSGDVTIPGLGGIDILKAADVGGKAWRFGGLAPGKPGAKPVQGQAAQQPATDPYAAILQQYANANTQIANSYQQPQLMQQMQQGPAAPDPQVAALQQQLETLRQEQQAGQNQQRARGPNVTYF